MRGARAGAEQTMESQRTIGALTVQSENRKNELLRRMRTAHADLEGLLAGLTDEQLTREGAVGAWSVKDILAHLTWWEQDSLRGLRGEPDEDILAGEEWNTDRANARMVERSRPRPLAEVLAAFTASYAELVSALEALPEERFAADDLYDHIASNTYEHYAGHTAAILAWLNAKPNAR
jgi:uncharacterized protein (TIGR03083 family)